MRIAFGSDAERFEQKQRMELFLIATGHVVEDFGTEKGEAAPYAQVVRAMAKAVASGEFQRAIVLGATGGGEAIVANRVPGVRCTVCWNTVSAAKSRRHLDANVLVLGLELMPFDDAQSIVETWLGTPFSRKRHSSEVAGIDGRLGQRLRGHSILPHRAPMLEATSYGCKICGQVFEIPIDLSAASPQQCVEVCPVCWHAHVIRVDIDDEGNVSAVGEDDGGYF